MIGVAIYLFFCRRRRSRRKGREEPSTYSTLYPCSSSSWTLSNSVYPFAVLLLLFVGSSSIFLFLSISLFPLSPSLSYRLVICTTFSYPVLIQLIVCSPTSRVYRVSFPPKLFARSQLQVSHGTNGQSSHSPCIIRRLATNPATSLKTYMQRARGIRNSFRAPRV
ncbi:hypothetical protein CPC08DRAFT_384401 [Agrocybe pediades]|nr:hypothetical protein CPC08DRAFT_384401 [Agrocybe pediades]